MASEVDSLFMERFVPFRERVLTAVADKHPQLMGMVNAFLSGKQNRFGVEVTEKGNVSGRYTLHLAGVKISRTEPDKLSPEIHHPFLGVIRPYLVVEKATLEAMLANEAAFMEDTAAAIRKYLPEVTVKFLRD
ncbi:Hypothetical protein LUCI_0654 [Lucifera butyrica]|uniref:Uncharacterized protein n=1 Tax=Lucifera butyrica TaxID=1351585 RepID=A0A498R1V7_9FIRM|nr:hypothetical protein [Lucifera butyrica]VBB05444.1 Hypothetical protein LUCI_0654 [Lucifera butyrica]